MTKTEFTTNQASIDRAFAEQDRALTDLRLTDLDFRVLWLANRRTRSIAGLAAILGEPRSTVQRSIEQLSACGYLRVQP